MQRETQKPTTEETQNLKTQTVSLQQQSTDQEAKLKEETTSLKKNVEDLAKTIVDLKGDISKKDRTIEELRIKISELSERLNNSTLALSDPKEQTFFRLNNPFLLAFFCLLTLNIGYYNQATIAAYCQALIATR